MEYLAALIFTNLLHCHLTVKSSGKCKRVINQRLQLLHRQTISSILGHRNCITSIFDNLLTDEILGLVFCHRRVSVKLSPELVGPGQETLFNLLSV